jgi:hypothetical protein
MEHQQKNNTKPPKPGSCCTRVPILETIPVLGSLVASTLISNTMVVHQYICSNGTAMAFSVLSTDHC